MQNTRTENIVIWLDGQPIKNSSNYLKKLYIDAICNNQVISDIIWDYLILRIEHPSSNVAEMIYENMFMFDKALLGGLCASENKYHVDITDMFLSKFDFTDLSIFMGLRYVCKTLTLPREAQMLDRVLNRFSRAYFAQHRHEFRSSESVNNIAWFILVTSPNFPANYPVLSEDAFVRNLRQMDDGQDYPLPMLQQLYQDIYITEGGTNSRRDFSLKASCIIT